MRSSPREGVVLAASRGGEVRLRDFHHQGREAVEASNAKEWKAIVDSGVVRVINKPQAGILRKHQAERMVRRWKPVEGTALRSLLPSFVLTCPCFIRSTGLLERLGQKHQAPHRC